MELKPVSQCGRICHTILGLFIIIMTSVTFSSTWWIVYFWDCVGNDQYYYLRLDDGLCYADSNGEEDNFEDCISWEDLEDNEFVSSEAQDDAGAYISADGLCKACLSFGVFLFVAIALQFVPQVREFKFGRHIIAAALGFTGILLLAAFSSTSNTYYTDVDNYLENDRCASYATSMYSGYACAVVAFILCFSTAASLLFPCCTCIGTTEEDPGKQSEGATANPITN